MKWFRLTSTLLALFTVFSARAGSDPDRVWFTLQTDHFAVHSYDEGEDLARRVAMFAEEAYAIVNPLLGYAPKERIHISVVDDVDSANGFAGVVPYSAITILGSPPLPQGALSSYDDWLRLLIIHEYAHIVHLNQTSGIPDFLNSVFGKNFAPNQSLPRWLTEGIATWVESHATQAGRLDSSRFKMLLRTQVLADRLLRLPELTGAPLTPPGASLWYLYGTFMVDEIVRGVGAKGLRRFTETYGRRIIPYGVNLAFRETTGKSLDGWYKAMTARVKAESRRTEKRIRRSGIKEGVPLTRGGFYKSHPRFSPDGRRLVFTRADGHQLTRLVDLDVSEPSKERELLSCRGGCGRFDFSRDGQHIWMSSGRHYRRVNFYRELIEIGATEKSSMGDARVVTQGARFGQLTSERTGARVWGIASSWGRTWIEARSPRDGRVLFSWRPAGYERVSDPVPTSKGDAVFFSMHAKGNQDLYRYSLADKQLERLTYGASIEFDLRLTPDGRWLLYTSDVDDVYNIYAREVATGKTVRLTNVLTGAFSPEVSPDGKTLVYVGWTADGQELYRMPFEPEGGAHVSVPDDRAAMDAPKEVKVAVTKTKYRPLNSMLPRSVLPSLTGDVTGLGQLGLYLGGHDISERLSGGLYFLYDFGREDFSLEGSLTFKASWPDVSLTFGRYTYDGESYVADQARLYREEVLYGALDVSLKFPSVLMPTSLNTGVTLEGFRSLDGFTPRHSPDQNSPYIPDEGLSPKVHFGWGFGNVARSELNISSSEGVSGYFGLGLRYRNLASHTAMLNFDYRLSSYLRMPWHADHVWAARLEGGWRGGDTEYVRSYRLGGVPPTNLLMDLVNLTQNASVWLRGFAPDALTGTSYHLLVSEYRFPLLRGRSGLDSLPIFFKDLHGAVFVDTGLVLEREISSDFVDGLGVGLGGELRLDVEVLFGLGLNLRVGYAYGLGVQGGHQFYFFLAPPP